MKLEIESSEQKLVYKVTNPSDLERSILLGSFFSEEDGILIKKYEKSGFMFEQDPAIIARNFEAHIREQVLVSDRKTRFENALNWICTTHRDKSIRWWLCGSGALYIRGIDVTPHDIDIMTDKSEISKIKDCVIEKIVEPFHHVNGWVVKGFGVISVDFRIDYAFEPEEWVDGNGKVDFGPGASKDLEMIVWKGHRILVPKVDYHIKSNTVRQRYDVVAKIEKYMEHMNHTSSIHRIEFDERSLR